MNGVVFRKEIEDLKEAGSVWNESKKYLPLFGLKPNNSLRLYRYPGYGQVRFTGLGDPNSKYRHQGAYYHFAAFDELTHFEESEFWYIYGRLRDATGQVKPYLRATCNPEDCWVADLISWWIDPVTGYPIPERDGVLRWLIRHQTLNIGQTAKKTLNYSSNRKDGTFPVPYPSHL